MKTAYFIKKYSKKIENVKGMTIDEYNAIVHEMECRREDTWSKAQYLKLTDMLVTIEENYITQNQKFHPGDIVKYHNRNCVVCGITQVVRVAYNSKMEKGIGHELRYLSNGRFVNNRYPIPESRITLVKVGAMANDEL